MLEKDTGVIIEKNFWQIIFKFVTVVSTIFIFGFLFYGIKLGILQDKNILINYMKQLGWKAPLFFILLQAIQVVFPVIPGGASCLAGVLSFGAGFGFIYNYVGLVLGSLVAFSISRKYGLCFVRKIFKEETIDKYLGYIRDHKFNKIFFLGIFLPGFPDDLLCYVAGISAIDYKTFLFIILAGKPFSLLLYSFFITLF